MHSPGSVDERMAQQALVKALAAMLWQVPPRRLAGHDPVQRRPC